MTFKPFAVHCFFVYLLIFYCVSPVSTSGPNVDTELNYIIPRSYFLDYNTAILCLISWSWMDTHPKTPSSQRPPQASFPSRQLDYNFSFKLPASHAQTPRAIHTPGITIYYRTNLCRNRFIMFDVQYLEFTKLIIIIVINLLWVVNGVYYHIILTILRIKYYVRNSLYTNSVTVFEVRRIYMEPSIN